MKINNEAKRLLLGLMLLASLACSVSIRPESKPPSSDSSLEALILQQTVQAIKTQNSAKPQAEQTPETQSADVALGDLSSQNAEVLIPAGAFERQDDFTLETLSAPPTVDIQGVEPLGAAISIKMAGETIRSSEPIKVILKFDSQGINERGEVLVGYHHQNYGWELFSPDNIDLEHGELSFVTYHFSEYSALKADDQVRIDQFIERSSTEEYVRRQAFAQTSKDFEDMVEAFLKEGMQVDDNRVVEIIVKGVVEQIKIGDIPIGDIGIALYDLNDGGKKDLAKITAENTMKYIGEKMLDEDNPFSEVTGDFGSVIALGEAYVSVLKNKGDSQEAVEILADQVMGNIPITGRFYKTGKRAAELAQHIRELWGNNEIEKAYQVYSKGGEGGHYGYSVDSVLTDPDAWNKITDQNRSSFEKVAGDYLTAYCKAEGIDESQLNEAARNKIRAEGLENLKHQFDERMARRDEIDQIKADNKALMEMFAEKNLLERMIGTNPMYTGHEDLEMLLNRLNHMAKKIQRDLGRSQVVDGADWDITDPSERSNMIPREVLVELTYQWYNMGLRFNPSAYDNIIKNIQVRLDKNMALNPDQITEMAEKVVKSYQAGGAESKTEKYESTPRKTKKKEIQCPFWG